jgi:crotonobetainyl-CoA:carnitine CoA-transferase CaiB-like acyl-CoA transferase
MAALQRAGVPAGHMLRVFELPDFGFYQARESVKMAGHPLIQHPFWMENSLARSERFGDLPKRPAPLQGEQTDRIVSDMLGLSDAEIRELHEAGVLETSSVPT